MTKPQSPCLNCKDRTEDCHSNCDQYHFYIARKNVYMDMIKKGAAENYNKVSYNRGRLERMYRK